MKRLGQILELAFLMSVGASIAVEVIVAMTFLGYPS